VSELVGLLGLAAHVEGGWFRETWRAAAHVRPAGYPADRPLVSAIYFLLHPGEHSRWHRVRSDEIWLWHRGGPLRLRLGGTGAEPDDTDTLEVDLGPDVAAGMRPQIVVPGRTWQSAWPLADQPVLVTCVVAPGFHYDDFSLV